MLNKIISKLTLLKHRMPLPWAGGAGGAAGGPEI